jgi:uncharacterized protein with ParB-like and HNH nuclease domain
MSSTPRGMAVQEAYRHFRDENLWVNRKYQRKLVWTIPEKERLIDSILKGYPIPLLLLAERPQLHGSGKYEIIDGIQRFNAIFDFIENKFPLNGKYFDVNQLARAKQLADQKVFHAVKKDQPKLSPDECADILDYQLAVTIFPALEENEIVDVFGRINSSGKQLSPQEKRQAGVISPFAEMVRKLSAELRGDASKEILLLSEMPEISIESKSSTQGYNLKAEEIFWCKQGILRISQLRDSEDEQMLADISASILMNDPIPVSIEVLDEFYSKGKDRYEELEKKLALYGADQLSFQLKATYSILKEMIENYNSEPNYLRRIVDPGSGNPIKTPFFSIFMAFFDLVVVKEYSPDNPHAIMSALTNLSDKLKTSAHYATTADRKKNINLTKGLIQEFFVAKKPPVLRHGPGLAVDFENAIRRSRIETQRYEFKQGLLNLGGVTKRLENKDLLARLVETMCGIANLGPEADGFIFIVVADSKEDADRIIAFDGINPVLVSNYYVVGVDRELTHLKISLDTYVAKFLSAIKNSELDEPLKTQILGKIEVVAFKGLSVVRIGIPVQPKISFLGTRTFTREGSSTVEIFGPQIVAVNDRFK